MMGRMGTGGWKSRVGVCVSGIVCVAIFSTVMSGCTLPTLIYFTAVMLGKDMRPPPPVDLLSYREKLNKPRKEPLRVAVVTYTDVGTQIHLGPLARELDDALSKALAKGFEQEKERLVVLAPSVVHRWQDRNDQWQALEPSEMARQLRADLVIFVELNNPSLYENGSNRTLYRARADVTVTVAPARMPDAEDVLSDLVIKEHLHVEFPRGSGPASVDPDLPPERFRRAFVVYLAQQISWLFVPHDPKEEFASQKF
jgi:hypothetical protein